MLARITNADSRLVLFYILGGLIIFSFCTGYLLEQPALLVLPVIFLVLYVAVVDFKWFYYLLFISLPISMHISIGGGFSMDVPSEPLMLMLTGIFILLLATSYNVLSEKVLRHPITLLLILHLGWIFVSAINSQNPIVSFKFLMAKIWFIVPFFFLTFYFVRDAKDIDKIFWLIFCSLMFTVVIVFIRHGFVGFSFREQKSIMGPFYSNHVIYANIMALFFPWIVLKIRHQIKGSRNRMLLICSAAFLLVAIYFSYTRAAYVSLIIAGAAYMIIRLRLMKYVLALSVVAMLALVTISVSNNKYLDYAPNYETTIAHKDFDKLMEATTKGEDLSTMERLYRWVAGFRMVESRPWMGFGPGNFYFAYKPYTLNRFKTYVSDNPEKSGTHNYFLMTATDQGIPGLIIFLVLALFTLIHGEKMYHQLGDDRLKDIVMACLLSLIVILSFLLINDMIELDKVGTFFFFWLALLVFIDNRYINKANAENP